MRRLDENLTAFAAGVDRHGPRPPPIVDASSCIGYAPGLAAGSPARNKAWRVQSDGQMCPWVLLKRGSFAV